MKKISLNRLNQGYILILLGMIIAIIVKINRYKAWARYDYDASCTAPLTYPVWVDQAYFLTENDERKDINYSAVNNQQLINWGDTDPGYYNGVQEHLPIALIISYASYRDSTFYRDSIPLPAELIKKLIKSSGTNGTARYHEPYTTAQSAPLTLLIGLANRGHLIIWLHGKKYERKIWAGNVKTTVPIDSQWYDNKRYAPKDYFKQFRLNPDLRDSISKGKDRNANYADSTTHYIEYNRP